MPDKKNDYYETLGINKGASEDEIKRAYRSLAKKHHPDANPGDKSAEDKFKSVSEAYSVLSDSQKRAAYDQYGHAAFDQAAGGRYSADFNMNDIFEQFFGEGGFGFGDIFGRGSRRQGPQRGPDFRVEIRIKFEEAVFGTEKEIQLSLSDSCDTCRGTGAQPGTHAENCRQCSGTGQERVLQQTMFGTMTSVRTCPACRGEGKIIKTPCSKCSGRGKVKKTKNIQVSIPKGIDEGQSVRISGKGEAGDRGGPNGDLLIGVRISAHRIFTRDGTNLYCDMPISFAQAALGDEINIPLLDGTEEKYTVKPGTQPGTRVTLRGKGVPNVRNNRSVGDLIATLNVIVPTSLTDSQKDALREFAALTGNDMKEQKKSFFKKF